jgi:4-amino-4-deoxy-L-arabinose transferase-like glycosyltransferase
MRANIARPLLAVRHKSFVFVIAIIFIASILRLSSLAEIPPGLYRDEAFNGLDALDVFRTGTLPIFFTANEGREPLFIYLQTIAVWLWGTRAWTLRLVAALVGIATIPLIYRLARTLFRDSRHADWIGVVAAGFLAVLYWHVHLSRIGFRAILLPALSSAAILFFWRGWHDGKRRDWLFSGLAVSAAFYTYTAARLLPLVFLGFVLSQFLFARHANRQSNRSVISGLLILSSVAMVTALPLLAYFAQDPATFGLHAGSISIFKLDASLQDNVNAFAGSCIAVIRMFIDRGDLWQKENLPGRPALDLLGVLGFWTGLLLLARRLREPANALVLIWLGTMLLPTLLSDNPPNFVRAIGAIPPLALVVAEGWRQIWQWLKLRWEILVIGIVAVSGAITARDYFIDWAARADVYQEFDAGIVTAAFRARELVKTNDVAIPLRYYGQPAPQFLLGSQFNPTTWLDIAMEAKPLAFVTPGNGGEDAIVVLHARGDRSLGIAAIPRLLDQSTLDAIQRRLAGADSAIVNRQGTRVGGTAMFAPGEINWQTLTPDNSLAISFANQIQLVGYDLQPAFAAPGKQVRLTLYWRASADVRRRYSVSLALQDTEQTAWASLDREPWFGDFSTDVWRAGESVLDVYQMTIPVEAHTGKYHFGVALRRDRQLDLVPATIDRVGGASDRIAIGAITVNAQGAQAKPPANPIHAAFGKPVQIDLLGYDFDTKTLLADSQIQVRLVWRAVSQLDADYTVFVHLLDAQGNIIAQHDSQPQGNYAPTSLWFVGEGVEDIHPLQLPSQLPLGNYSLAIGMYNWKTGERLSVIDTHGERQVDDQILISQINLK